VAGSFSPAKSTLFSLFNKLTAAFAKQTDDRVNSMGGRIMNAPNIAGLDSLLIIGKVVLLKRSRTITGGTYL
jgi:hypothetical protein